MTDHQLLTAYTQGSHEAFHTLTTRYLGLVYSAAQRQAPPHLAEDITQAVFLLLAQRAHTFRNPQLLPAWLLKVTRFCAAAARRSDHRRKRHEQKVAAMAPTQTTSQESPESSDLQPHLHAALLALSETDRTALLLRFYNDQSLAEIALSLNTTEGAAKKRVARALEKLRQLFARKNLTLAIPILAATLANQSHAAPPALAAKIAAGALAPAAAVTSATLIAKGATTLMATTKISAAIALSAACLALLAPISFIALHAAAGTPPQAATTPALSPEENFLSYYALQSGEALKLVTAPPEARAAMFAALQSPQDHPIDPPPGPLLFDWHAGKPESPLIFAQPQLPLPQAVAGLASLALNITPEQIQITAPIPANALFTIPGDIVYDTTLPADQTLRALEATFHKRMNLNLSLSFKDVDQRVYVLHGDWKFTPVPDPDPLNLPEINGQPADPLIEIYGTPSYDPAVKKPGHGVTIDARGLASQIAAWIHAPVIIEARSVPHFIGWRWNNSPELTPDSETRVHTPAAVLKHITEQTALTWTQETRKTRQLIIQPAPTP